MTCLIQKLTQREVSMCRVRRNFSPFPGLGEVFDGWRRLQLQWPSNGHSCCLWREVSFQAGLTRTRIRASQEKRIMMPQTFQNLDRCLKAAGATWADVIKTNSFVTDFDEFQKCADIRMRYLGMATRTSTTVGVTRLAGPDFMIEIEAVAVVNS